MDLDLTSQDDPRVGSGRDDSDGGGTLSANSGSQTSSLAKLGATFIPISIYLAVCLILFIVLRPRSKRVYAPRTIAGLPSTRPPCEALPDGWFNWVKPFFKVPDSHVLNHGSLDGFLFLRYLKVLRTICIAGCCITWPVLFPIHATGGNGLEQLELLTMGNVKDPRYLFAHAIVAWMFFGFVLFVIVRESIYYVNLHQAYLSSPSHANRLAARTLMVTGVPQQYLDERRLKKLYGDAARRIWVPRTTKALAHLVKEREQTAMRLEQAEIVLTKKANAAMEKHLRKNRTVENSITARFRKGTSEDGSPRSPTSSDATAEAIATQTLDDKAVEQTDTHQNTPEDDYVHPYGLGPSLPDVRGSVAALWIPASARPHHRPLGNFIRRVDTIKWTRERLKDLNVTIYKLRRSIRRDPSAAAALPAAFIEFHTQEGAQAAHQTLIHHRPLQMASRFLDVKPEEVLWASLRMPWWELIVRRVLVISGIVAAIVFWSIPSAMVGIVSNVDFLSGIAFLSWIQYLPAPILGFLSGFVPALALSLFMALVPGMLRVCAAQAGVPSLVAAELFCQRGYFAFQVVQVFLITTLTSAASGALFDIVQDPLEAQNLLAQNLPRASNFYLSYILIQSIAAGAGGLLHLLDLFRHHVFSRFITIPRSQHRLWKTLRPVHWGGVFPVFTNMGVIAMSYACIAPLILVFAGAGMAFMHLVWRYNLIYVYDSQMDSKGLFYPRALSQLIVGLYLAQLCLIGLFVINGAFGPMIMMILLLAFTVLVDFTLSDAIAPLVQNLPQTLPLEEEIREEEKQLAAAAATDVEPHTDDQPGGTAASYYDTEQAFGDESNAMNQIDEEEEEDYDHTTDHVVSGNRAIEGAGGITSVLGSMLKTTAQDRLQSEADASGLTSFFAKLSAFFTRPPDDTTPPSFMARWLHPEIHEDFLALRKMLPEGFAADDEPAQQGDYLPPELWLDKPTLWIPRDEARVSRQEVAHSKGVTPVTDRGAKLDVKGRVVVDLGQAPFKEPRIQL
ncbi:hypothetical protein S40288_02329 [Stachybotrys chartarum IBT 40288]|nr:hypothetical protein S40288_02329 [Stachybotrys chartarum IBT 40288]